MGHVHFVHICIKVILYICRNVCMEWGRGFQYYLYIIMTTDALLMNIYARVNACTYVSASVHARTYYVHLCVGHLVLQATYVGETSCNADCV